jgi:hypothetical protein
VLLVFLFIQTARNVLAFFWASGQFTVFIGENWCALQGSNLPKTQQNRPDSAAASQIDSQENAELKEIASAWPHLTDPLKAAVLAIVRTVRGNGAGRERE